MRSSIATLALSSSLLYAATTARDIPENIKKLRESIIARGDCEKKLASGFRSVSTDEKSMYISFFSLGDQKTITFPFLSSSYLLTTLASPMIQLAHIVETCSTRQALSTSKCLAAS